MENGVYQTFYFPWTHFDKNNKYLDKDTYFDRSRWNKLYADYYHLDTIVDEVELDTVEIEIDTLDNMDMPDIDTLTVDTVAVDTIN